MIEFGSKTAEKNSAETNRQTNRHYENNGHLAVNQTNTKPAVTAIQESLTFTDWMSEILVIFRVNVSSFDLVIVSNTTSYILIPPCPRPRLIFVGLRQDL